MSTYIAEELRALVDEPPTAATAIRLLELAVIVERMEKVLDEQVAEARDDAVSLDGLIRRCNAG
jgi:hypothetical protein